MTSSRSDFMSSAYRKTGLEGRVAGFVIRASLRLRIAGHRDDFPL